MNAKEQNKEIFQDAKPEAGTRVPAHKEGRGAEDTLKAGHKVEKGTMGAGTENKGACKKAADKQCGKNMDDMTQPNSGCGCCDDCDK